MDAVYTSFFLFPFNIWYAHFLYIVWFHLNMSENLLFKSTAKALLGREEQEVVMCVVCSLIQHLQLMFLMAHAAPDNITTWCLHHTLHFSKYFYLIWFSLQLCEVSKTDTTYFTNETIQSVRWWIEGQRLELSPYIMSFHYSQKALWHRGPHPCLWIITKISWLLRVLPYLFCEAEATLFITIDDRIFDSVFYRISIINY